MVARSSKRSERAHRLTAACLMAALVSSCGPGDSEDSDPRSAGPSDRGSRPWLREIAEESGLDFRHSAGVIESYATPEIIGSGGAVFDYDDDGDGDVYLVDAGVGPEPARNRLRLRFSRD